MLTTLLLQSASVAFLALGAWVLIDGSCAFSVALGGVAAIVPNGLFALRLAVHRGKSSETYPVVFMVGEFVKLGLTVLLLVLIAMHAEPVWPCLLVGLIAALQAPLFVPLLLRPNGPSKASRAIQAGTD